MRYEIEYNPAYAMLIVELRSGEQLRAEPGSMVTQENVELKTGGAGSVFKGFKRLLGGESFFVNTFTGNAGGGVVRLAPATPGAVSCFELQPRGEIFLQSGAFLACEEGIDVDAKWQGFKGFFSGESLFFVHITAGARPGAVFYNCYGAIEEIHLTPGRELVVDTGHLVAFTEGLDYTVGKVGGLRSLVAGGEGLVMKLRGEGTCWVQTRDLQSLAEKLIPFWKDSKGG